MIGEKGERSECAKPDRKRKKCVGARISHDVSFRLGGGSRHKSGDGCSVVLAKTEGALGRAFVVRWMGVFPPDRCELW